MLLSKRLPNWQATSWTAVSYLTGGGALLKNLDHFLRIKTGLPIMLTNDPLSTVVLGSGKALDEIAILKDVLS